MKTKRIYEPPHVTIVEVQTKCRLMLPFSENGSTNECLTSEYNLWEDEWEEDYNCRSSANRSIWDK